MAESGAYYQGLTQAANVKPVDFGSIASAFADVEMKKREKQELEAREKEKQQIDAYKEFGVIYDQYEPTSLQNLNVIGADIKNKVLQKAQRNNLAFQEGSMSYSDYYKNNMMLKSESEKYRMFISGIGSFAEQVAEKGENASAETLAYSDLINNMLEEGVNVVEDANGQLSLLSKTNGKPSLVPFNILDKIAQVKEKTDIYQPLEDILKTTKPSIETGKNAVVATYLNKGELNSTQTEYIKDWFKGKTDGQMLDILESLDIEADYVIGPKGFELKDREALVDTAMKEYMEEAKNFLKSKEVRNEVDFTKLSLQQQNTASLINARNADKPEAERDIVDPVENGTAITFRVARKIPLISVDGQAFTDVKVARYIQSDNGDTDQIIFTKNTGGYEESLNDQTSIEPKTLRPEEAKMARKLLKLPPPPVRKNNAEPETQSNNQAPR